MYTGFIIGHFMTSQNFMMLFLSILLQWLTEIFRWNKNHNLYFLISFLLTRNVWIRSKWGASKGNLFYILQLTFSTSNNKYDWNPIKYLNVLHHNKLQSSCDNYFLNILQKDYQLSILSILDMCGHFHQKG